MTIDPTADIGRRGVSPEVWGNRLEIAIVRTVHTAVFVGELAAIAWLVVSGWLGRRDRSVGIAAIAVAAESAVFVANDGVCPLTPLTERLGAAHGGVSDIFLPDVVARTIPIWSTGLLVAAGLLHGRGLVRGLYQPPALRIIRWSALAATTRR